MEDKIKNKIKKFLKAMIETKIMPATIDSVFKDYLIRALEIPDEYVELVPSLIDECLTELKQERFEENL